MWLVVEETSWSTLTDGIAYVRYTFLHTCNATGTAPLVCVSSPRAQDRDTHHQLSKAMENSKNGSSSCQDCFAVLATTFQSSLHMGSTSRKYKWRPVSFVMHESIKIGSTFDNVKTLIRMNGACRPTHDSPTPNM